MILLAGVALAVSIHAQISGGIGPAWLSPPQAGAATVVMPDPKCGQYEHVQRTYGHCANTCEPGATACVTSCIWIPASVSCVDDMHGITERDWQGLMKRIEKLEGGGITAPGALLEHVLPSHPAGNPEKGYGEPVEAAKAPQDSLKNLTGNPGPDQHIEIGPLDAVITYEPYDQAGHAFPSSPTPGETWHGFAWDGKRWYFVVRDLGMRDCSDTQHLHPVTMPAGIPDIYGGPAPVADGKCHDNQTDAAILPHGRKLEAKR